MTELQIKAQALEEERRHNRATEKLSHAQNAITQKHYTASDAYTEQHYIRSDTAGLISANANAMNAETNRINADTNKLNADTSRKQYEMQHDIEYGWTGDYGYPNGMPLTAQYKSAQTQALVETTEADVALKEAQRKQTEVNSVVSVVNAIFGKPGVLGTAKTWFD